jgi:hypothetical protein
MAKSTFNFWAQRTIPHKEQRYALPFLHLHDGSRQYCRRLPCDEFPAEEHYKLVARDAKLATASLALKVKSLPLE